EPDFLWRRMPHPVVLFGRSISFFDRKWNYRRGKTGRGRLRSGVMAMLCLVLLAVCGRINGIVVIKASPVG
ncbi:cobalamin biosynthesis protein, partial [Alphaproteobacteria bacterium]|nr:cobalamin biosynthesis protein [Alphaproteobacteria bacterium]